MDLLTQWRRKHALNAEPPDFVRDWLGAPWPRPRQSWRELRFTALDLETSGLDPRRHEILSVGLVHIEGGAIRDASAWHSLVEPPAGHVISALATSIHGLDVASLQGAPALASVLPELMRRWHDSILLVHVSSVDHPFLQRAIRACWPCGLWMPALDTARFASWFAAHPQLGASRGEEVCAQRLSEIAASLGVLAGRAHDALEDALTCARVFVALCERLEHMQACDWGSLRRIAG